MVKSFILRCLVFGDPNYLDLKDFTSLRHYATCIN